MNADELQILIYLKPLKDFTSPKVLARHVGGKTRFNKDPNWAKPILLRLVEEGVLEANPMGHVRYKTQEEGKKRTRKPALAPNILAILKSSGKDFGCDLDAEDDAEPPPEPGHDSPASPR